MTHQSRHNAQLHLLMICTETVITNLVERPQQRSRVVTWIRAIVKIDVAKEEYRYASETLNFTVLLKNFQQKKK